MLQQAGPHERGAQPVKGDGREQHPDGERPQPGRGAESLAGKDQRPEERVEQDEELVSQQLVLHEPAPGHGTREQKGDFGRCEGEHPALNPEDPAPERRAHDAECAQQLNPTRPHDGRRCRLRPLLHRHDPEVGEAEDERGQIPWAPELADLAAHTIVGRPPGEVGEDPDHVGGWLSGVMSARNTSSSRRPLSAG